MQNFFKDLFSYHYHLNNRCMELFEKHPVQLSSTYLLFAHLLNSQHVWNRRIEGKQPEYLPWQEHNNFGVLNEQNFQETLHLLDQYSLEDLVTYNNTQGQTFQNSVQEILFHVINHTTHHRGQLVSQWKSLGITGPVTDYIFIKRQPL